MNNPFNMKLLLPFVFFIAVFSVAAQDIPIETFKEFAPRLNPSNDTVYVINFWATWCKPCVEEMPDFEKLQEEYEFSNLVVLLVSLDFKSQYEKKLIPFVNENQIKSQILLLNAPDYNSWIPKVSKAWNGAIPATLIVHQPTNTRMFFERQMHFDELESIVKPLTH